MIRLSRFQRLALIAASTTVITGGVLSGGAAFAAPAAPHPAAVAAGHLDAAAQWQQITDKSGISVQLPGKPRVRSNADNGVDSRAYVVPTGYGGIRFSVYDGPAGSDPNSPWDIKGGLKSSLDAYNSGDPSGKLTSTGVHEGMDSGHHYLEAELVGADGSKGHIRIVDLGQQAIEIMNVGTGDQKHALDRDYQQVLDSIKLPDHRLLQAGETAVAV